jgi:hypothetical protein
MKTKAIKDIKVGDYVQSYNHEADELVSAKVVEVFKHENVPGKKIIINNDFIATGNHPIYINGKYKPASKVKVSDTIINPEGLETKVHTLTSKPMDIDVYNIEVEGDHNYFAGGILNHNKCGEYVGDDDAIGPSITTIESSAKIYQGSLQGYMDTYYDAVNQLVGQGIATDPASSGMDFTYTDESGQDQSFGTPQLGGSTGNYYSQQTSAGGLTTYGSLTSKFETSQDQYNTALESAAGLVTGATDALDLTKTDTATTLEDTGMTIAGEAEDALKEVQVQSSQRGFAQTGQEEMMKQDIRSQQGEGWQTATDIAQSSMTSAIDAYEKVMGSGEAVTIGGEEIEDIGSYQTALDTAATSKEASENEMRRGIAEIERDLTTLASTLRSDLGQAAIDFNTATASAYVTGGDDMLGYIDDYDTIKLNVEKQVNQKLFGAGTTKVFDTASFHDFGFDEGADAAMAGGQGTGEKGDYDPHWYELGIGKCLEGNVQVVMGGKNGRN